MSSTHGNDGRFEHVSTVDHGLIERLHLIESQFGEVVVPTAVWTELTAGSDGRDRIEALRDWDGMRVVRRRRPISEPISNGGSITERPRPSRMSLIST